MNIDRAIALIQDLHEGQTDWSGEPYWNHPVAVMRRLHDEASDQHLLALLHDVVEDCWEVILPRMAVDPAQFGADLTQEAALLCYGWLIQQGVPRHVIAGLRLVTRIPGEFTYSDMIDRIVNSGHVDAMMVKLADNMENTCETRVAKLNEVDRDRSMQMRPRYLKSMAKLRAGLAALGEVSL